MPNDWKFRLAGKTDGNVDVRTFVEKRIKLVTVSVCEKILITTALFTKVWIGESAKVPL